VPDVITCRPVVAICGFKNSGKTTLIERLVPILRADGLAVAVVKHDAHGLEIDHPGRDTDRIFRSGADVLALGLNQRLQRIHPSSNAGCDRGMEGLFENHDVVLVEGARQTQLPKIWLHRPDEKDPPADVFGIALELVWEADRVTMASDWIREWIAAVWKNREIRGVVLMGGKSRRMGRPKQTLEHGAKTLSEIAVDAVRAEVSQVVIAGSAAVPDSLRDVKKLPDPPGISGPLAGILAAMRWSPDSAWVVAACDMPRVSDKAISWLLAQRRPGRWAVLPRSRAGQVEALLAVYEPMARPLLEAQVAAGRWGPRHLAENGRVSCPQVPPELEAAWMDVNTQAELRKSLESNE
jgi:glutamate dehydrogenase (NADP+)/cyclic pyranopterin phosphate synthase/molybdopterin-guanine dinucleotide biosynthesis protein A